MKRTITVLMLAAFCSSCGNNENKSETTTSADSTQTTTAAPAPPAEHKLTAEEEKGETLIAQSDCLGCHKIEDRIIGPSYREVAAKYASDPAIKDTLAQRIIKGHKGVWGEQEMTAHPTLSQDDAKAMVSYILSLKQQ